jgi:hypothetical protein
MKPKQYLTIFLIVLISFELYSSKPTQGMRPVAPLGSEAVAAPVSAEVANTSNLAAPAANSVASGTNSNTQISKAPKAKKSSTGSSATPKNHEKKSKKDGKNLSKKKSSCGAKLITILNCRKDEFLNSNSSVCADACMRNTKKALKEGKMTCPAARDPKYYSKAQMLLDYFSQNKALPGNSASTTGKPNTELSESLAILINPISDCQILSPEIRLAFRDAYTSIKQAEANPNRTPAEQQAIDKGKAMFKKTITKFARKGKGKGKSQKGSKSQGQSLSNRKSEKGSRKPTAGAGGQNAMKVPRKQTKASQQQIQSFIEKPKASEATAQSPGVAASIQQPAAENNNQAQQPVQKMYTQPGTKAGHTTSKNSGKGKKTNQTTSSQHGNDKKGKNNKSAFKRKHKCKCKNKNKCKFITSLAKILLLFVKDYIPKDAKNLQHPLDVKVKKEAMDIQKQKAHTQATSQAAQAKPAFVPAHAAGSASKKNKGILGTTTGVVNKAVGATTNVARGVVDTASSTANSATNSLADATKAVVQKVAPKITSQGLDLSTFLSSNKVDKVEAAPMRSRRRKI